MAPVEIQASPSYVPAVTAFSHILATGYLTTLTIRTIYRSYLTLPPSSATRFREPLRKGHVQTFSLLALVSLAVAFFYGVAFSGLSYRVWATERGVELPQSIFGEKGAFRGGQHPGRFQGARWLSDTTFYQDFVEIVAEKARYYWWGQQITLGMLSWSQFVAIEGQRRNIPYLWAFMALAQLVTLLLTPVPLPDNVRELTRESVPITSNGYSHFLKRFIPTKPTGWSPNPYLQNLFQLVAFSLVFLTPFAANTPSFMTVSLLSRSMAFFPLVLPYFIPESWGTTHAHPHEAYSTYTITFRSISFVAALLHFKSTALSLFYNTPESYYYRHSLLHPFLKEHLSTFNRGSAAVTKLFGAIREHPAVSAVGWDVILCGLSLGVWAAARGLDGKEILGSSLPFMTRTEKQLEEADITPPIKIEEAKALQTSIKRRVGRPRKSESTFANQTASVTRRRGRSSKLVDEDADYQPAEGDLLEEGDEDAEEDWEVGALAWGLITAGGLGAGSAGVYGAEIMAR